MLTGIVSELVVDSSNTDSSLDTLNEYIQSVNNRIDTQIESLEQSLLANISAGDTAVKTELLNVINNKFADTAGDLTDLKNEIISDVDEKLI